MTERMTLIIALNCSDAKEPGKRTLLFAADKQRSALNITMQAEKIRRFYFRIVNGRPLRGLLFAGSGSALLLDEVWFKIDNYLRENEDFLDLQPVDILRKYREEFGDISYEVYEKYSSRYESEFDLIGCSFDFILGANDGIAPTILYVNNMGNNQIEDRFKIIGTGLETGGELLLEELYKAELNFREAAILATFIINRVSNVDISVGGGIDWYLIRDNVPQPPTERFFKHANTKAEDNWNIMKQIFWQISDNENLRKEITEKIKSPSTNSQKR